MKVPFADLHCDTVTECFKRRLDLWENDLFLSFSKAKFEKYLQVAAIFIPDELRGEDAYSYYRRNMDFLKSQIEKHSDKFILIKSKSDLKRAEESGKIGIVAAVEGLGFEKNLDRLQEIVINDHIKFATLTWNGENYIAGGAYSDSGLTSYGKEALAVLKEHKVIADVSHLNEKSFYGVLEYAQGKIVATHSLSYSVFPHKRNLKDGQIKSLYEKKGLVGLNLYPDFIKGKDCVASEVFPHIEKLVSLTGYDFLGFGGDFDGADMPSDLKGIEDMDGFLEDLRAFLKDDKAFLNIAYNNVRNFIYDAF